MTAHRTMILLLALTGLTLAGPAGAREGWTVRSVKVTGLPSGVASPESKLQLAAKPGFLGGDVPVFSETALQQDLRRLRLLLARHGYPYAEIQPEVTPDARGRRVNVVFMVRRGRPVRVTGVRVGGLPPELAAESTELTSGLTPGRVLTDAVAEDARSRLAMRLARAGYVLGEVTVAVERPDSFSAVTVFQVVAGERQRIVRTTVSGVRDDLAVLAQRSMSIPDSVLASPDLLEQARDNLRELELFRQIRLETTPAGPGALELKAGLAPATSRSAQVSVGSWSDDPIRLSAEWKHRNLFRRGRGLSFQGSYSPYLQELDADAWWPALFGARSVTGVGTTWLREDEDSYTLENRLVEVSLLLRAAGRLSLRLGVSLEDVLVSGAGLDQTTFTDPDGRQFVLNALVHDDHTDQVLEPSRGYRVTMALAWSPAGALSVSPFGSAETTVAAYAPLPAGVVLATRTSLGVALPLGDADSLLPNRRFFAGGVTTMRGYKRRRLGPVDDDDDPVGGQARLLAAAELRAPLSGLFELAAFVDAGQVWADRTDLSLDGLATAAGGGLVVRTPVGPVRADVARLLQQPRDGEPRTVIHLSIGHPF